MANKLRHQLLIHKIVRRVSPGLLVSLVKQFAKIDSAGMKCVKLRKAAVFENIHFGEVPKALQKEYAEFQSSVKRALFSLKSPDDDNLLVEAHLLAVATEYELASQLEDITKIPPRGLSSEDYITTVYLKKGRAALQQAIRMVEAQKTKQYEYYQASRTQLGFSEYSQVREPTPELLAGEIAALKEVLSREYSSELCEYDIGVYGTRFHLDITHAGATLQGDKAVGDKTDTYVVQPVEYDTLFVDFKTGELCIHMENKRTKVLKEYVMMMSDLFYQEKEHWSKDKKYNLHPFTHLGKTELERAMNVDAALKSIKIVDESAKLIRVRLVSLTYKAKARDGTSVSHIIKSAGCMSKSIDDGEMLVHSSASQTEVQITTAVFAFDLYRYGTDIQTIRISVHENKRSECEILRGLDEWLSGIGLLRAAQTDGTPPEWFTKLLRMQQKRFEPRRIVETVMQEEQDGDGFSLSNDGAGR